MPRKTSKTTLKKNTLRISKENYDRILMWSQSEKEIIFICLGTENTVKNVVRMCNISKAPKNYCLYSEIHCAFIRNSLEFGNQKILAYGHSHPSPSHDKHPSSTDIKNSSIGEIEVIAFPISKKILAWKIDSTLLRTIQNQVKIQVF